MRIDVSLRIGDVLTALDEHATLSPDTDDAPTWLEDASDALRSYTPGQRPVRERIVIHVKDGTQPLPWARLTAADDSADVFVVRGIGVPPDAVLDCIATHRRPHVGLVFTNWPYRAGRAPRVPSESPVVLASAGDIKAASGNGNIDAIIEILGHSLKSQLVPVAPEHQSSDDRQP